DVWLFTHDAGRKCVLCQVQLLIGCMVPPKFLSLYTQKSRYGHEPAPRAPVPPGPAAGAAVPASAGDTARARTVTSRPSDAAIACRTGRRSRPRSASLDAG